MTQHLCKACRRWLYRVLCCAVSKPRKIDEAAVMHVCSLVAAELCLLAHEL